MWYFVAIYEQILLDYQTNSVSSRKLSPKIYARKIRQLYRVSNKLHQTGNPGYPFVCPSSPEGDILGPECNCRKRWCSVLDIHSVLFWKLSWPSHNIHNPEHSSHHGPHSPYAAIRRDTS